MSPAQHKTATLMRRCIMKRSLVFITILSISVFFFSIALAEFWGSKKSDKYHSPSCTWAQKINPKNLVKFNTPQDAARMGYVPCKVCRPPAASRSGLTQDPIVVAKLMNQDDPQRRGCCSHHGGVCGCQNGRAVCCDGAISPSCGCD